MSNTFDDIGFLSPTVAIWAQRVRAEFSEHFEIAERLNRLGMRLLFALPTDRITSDAVDFAARAYARALESFQAALLLAQIGALAEARALVRLSLEAAIAVSALKVDPDGVAKQLREDYQRGRRALANSILEGVDGKRPAEADAARLRAVLDEIDREYGKRKLSPINWDAMARCAGMKGFYDMVYRCTSANAAHLNLGALQRHAVADESNELIGYRFQPEKSDLRSTLFAANATLANAIGTMIAWFDLSQFSDELDDCVARWRETESDDR